jgi:hypothetical protein
LLVTNSAYINESFSNPYHPKFQESYTRIAYDPSRFKMHDRVIQEVGQELTRLTSIGKTGDLNAAVD